MIDVRAISHFHGTLRGRHRRGYNLQRLFDECTPEARGCAIVVYNVAFALFQEWHAEKMRARNIQRLRAAVRKERAA